MQVFKFGGASVKDAPSVVNAANIIRSQTSQEPTVVVVSAMAKTTNKLEDILKAWYYGNNDSVALFSELKEFHFGVLKQLIPDVGQNVYTQLENDFLELQWQLEEKPVYSFSKHYDQIVSLGEIFSTRILSAYLNFRGIQNQWLDARDYIKTDDNYREGNVNYEQSEHLIKNNFLPFLQESKIIITQGFIGGTSENFTTTLGREGSDYTASLMAYFLNAKRVVIWKDVPGVLNADPRYFKNAQKMDELSYHEAIELTYYGASVIHPKTIKPLQNKNIPLYVKSFLKPEEEGTIICNTENRLPVPGYILKTNQVLISFQPKDFSFIAEDKLSIIFSALAKHGLKVNLMQNSAISFSICTDSDAQKLHGLIEELKNHFKILYNENLNLLTVRNYDSEIVGKLAEDKKLILEQRSRNTWQMVLME